MRWPSDTWCSPLSMSFLSPVSCWGFRGENFPMMAQCSMPAAGNGRRFVRLITVDIFDLHTAVVYIAGKKVGLIRGAEEGWWSPGR